MATIQTGVGVLPVGTRITALMAVLAHNAEVRNGKQGRGSPGETDLPMVQVAGNGGERQEGDPRGGSQVARGLHGPHTEVPSARLNIKFYEQWERQLMWATMRALLDHQVFPRAQAVGMARRLASKVMKEYAPLIANHTSSAAT